MHTATLNIFDIQRFSWQDGPGIRTVVFLKGCDMKCFWCHNPEGMSPNTEMLFHSEKCIQCGKCVETCDNECHSFTEDGEHQFDRTACVRCGRCAESCYSEALIVVGKRVTIDSILDEVLEDTEFYRLSGGGVTLSGGEPLMQAEGCRELLRRLREPDIDVNTAVDTAGNVPWSAFEMILPVTDYLLFDIKMLDDDVHKKVTGVSNRLILDNLRRLRGTDVRLIIRIPIIPGVNDSPGELESIAKELRDFDNICGLDLLPFHKIGAGKYEAMGRNYQAESLRVLERDRIDELRSAIQ